MSNSSTYDNLTVNVKKQIIKINHIDSLINLFNFECRAALQDLIERNKVGYYSYKENHMLSLIQWGGDSRTTVKRRINTNVKKLNYFGSTSHSYNRSFDNSVIWIKENSRNLNNVILVNNFVDAIKALQYTLNCSQKFGDEIVSIGYLDFSSDLDRVDGSILSSFKNVHIVSNMNINISNSICSCNQNLKILNPSNFKN